jgi:hypothetical protein
MSITAQICRVDEEGRIVFQDDDDFVDEDGYLWLDRWQGLQTMLNSVTAIDLFSQESLDSSDVGRLAKVLRPLIWSKALDTCEAPEDHDPEYLEEIWGLFRDLVLAAADEGSGLRCDFN